MGKVLQTGRSFGGIKIESWPIENLTPYDMNVKKHEKDQVRKIAESIQRHGFDQPIVVDRHGVIIKGHGRRLAAIELGMTHIDVIVRSDLSEDQVKAARLADNRVAQGDVDTDMLQEELASIDEDLTGIFDEKELEFTRADLGEMNIAAFESDMGAVVEAQREEIASKTDAAVEGRIPLHKAFGFKDIPASAAIAITRLMAVAEEMSGVENADALVAYASAL